MANWKLKVSFKDFWGEYKEGKSSIQKTAEKVVKKLNKLLNGKFAIELKEQLEEIIMEFEDIAESPELTVDDFDNVLKELYDWGDTELNPYGKFPPNKLCWISTII